MVERLRLPDFVIVGAPKAATTWLQFTLRTHCDIFMPGPELELHFFNRKYDRGLNWYAQQFTAARIDQIVGEKSATYLADPIVPDRLRSALPEAKLIIQLRNPIERAYSDYCMLFRRGEVNGDIDHYLDPRTTTMPRFLQDGLYNRHILAYLERFPREQIEITLCDDVLADPANVFREIAGFIGLRNPRLLEGVGPRPKDRTLHYLPPAARKVVRPLKRIIAPYRNRPMIDKAVRSVHALFARPIQYPNLSPELRRRMQDFYAKDVDALATLLGRDLRHWINSKTTSR